MRTGKRYILENLKLAGELQDSAGANGVTVAQIKSSFDNNHTHSNKALLDTYTQTEADIADAISKEHTHSNKAQLDLITDEGVYTLKDGSRAFTGAVVGVTPTLGSHLATKDYVDGLVQGLDWQDSVLDRVGTLPDSGLSTGDRYILTTDKKIYEYNGSGWDSESATEGMASWVEDEDVLYMYNGSDWVKFGSTVTHSNLSGLQGGTSDEFYHLTSSEYSELNGWLDDVTLGADGKLTVPYAEVNQDGNATALNVDISTGYIGINVNQHTSSLLGTGHALQVTSSTYNTGADSAVVKFNSTHVNTSQPLLELDNDSGGHGIYLHQDGALSTNRYGLYIYSNTAQSYQLFKIVGNNTGSSAQLAHLNQKANAGTMLLQQDGNGPCLDIDNNGTDNGLYIHQDGTLASNNHALLVESSVDQDTSSLAKFNMSNSSSSKAGIWSLHAGTGACVRLQNTGNGPHLKFQGDPNVSSPVDGDMWFDGTSLNFRDGSTTHDLLAGGGGASTLYAWHGYSGEYAGGGDQYGWQIDKTSYTSLDCGDTKLQYYHNNQTTYRTFISTKFIKRSWMTYLTLSAEMRGASSNGGRYAKCRMNAGSLNIEATISPTTNFTWGTSSALDISSLSNDTVYDLTFQLANNYDSESAFVRNVVVHVS